MKSTKSKASPHTRFGFSLVEIMVVVAILGLLAIGAATWLANLNKSTQNVSQKGELNSLNNELQGIFNNTQSCISALADQPGFLPAHTATLPGTFDPPIPASIKVGSTVYRAGFKYSSSLEIESLNFTGVDTASAGQFLFQMEMKTKRLGATGAPLPARIFNLVLRLDSSGKIVGCAGQYDNLWVRNGIDSILYNGTVNATAYMYISDARLKTHVRDIPSALSRVLKLQGVKYDWKDNQHRTNRIDQLGLVAQDVESVFPEAVNTNPQTGIKSVAYGNLVAPLIEAIKEQQQIILQQQREIAEIKKSLSTKSR